MDHSKRDYKRLKRIEGFNHARGLNWSCFSNRAFFNDPLLCERLIEAIRSAQAKHAFDLWAWCIMPTHVHLVIYLDPRAASPVSRILSSIKVPVTQWALARAERQLPDFLQFMRDEQPSGAVAHRIWQRGGGYDRNLTNASTVWEMIDYVHMNPVEAGLCARPADWPWSSAITYQDRHKGKLTIQHERLPERPRR